MVIFVNPLLPFTHNSWMRRTEMILEVMPEHLDDVIQSIRSKYGNRNYFINQDPPEDWFSLPDENMYIFVGINHERDMPGCTEGSKYVDVYGVKEMKAQARAELEEYLEQQRKEDERIDQIVKEAKEKYPDDYQGMVDYMTRGLYRR